MQHSHRSRRIAGASCIVAEARTNMTDPNHYIATAIKNESPKVPLFTAPCACKILGIKANALTWPWMAAGGSLTLTPTKAVIGGADVALAAAMTPHYEDLLFCQADDGLAITDESVPAAEDTANDMTLLPAVPVAEDAYYFGPLGKFDAIYLNITTAAADLVHTYAWEYWNGAAYVAIPLGDLTDETLGFAVETTGWKKVSWESAAHLAGWATVAVDGDTAYYVRLRVVTYTSDTTIPIGGQVYLVPDGYDDLTAETARDFTLSTTAGVLDLIEGQEVYMICAVANLAVVARSDALYFQLEWTPTEK